MATTKLKIQLIEDWRCAHKFASVQISLFGLLYTLADNCTSIWTALPAEVQAQIPHGVQVYSAIFFLATVCRVLKFGKVADGGK